MSEHQLELEPGDDLELGARLRALSDGVHAAPSPPTDLVARIRRDRRRRRALLPAACAACVLAVLLGIGVVLQGAVDRVDPADGSEGLPGVPWLDRGVDAGDNWEELPRWLEEFVVARGAVPALPVMADPSLVADELGIVCEGGPDANPEVGDWALPIDRSTECTFVLHLLRVPGTDRADGSTTFETPGEICLRRHDAAVLTPCEAGRGDPAQPIPGTPYEAVIWRRNFPDVDPERLRVDGVVGLDQLPDDARVAVADVRG